MSGLEEVTENWWRTCNRRLNLSRSEHNWMKHTQTIIMNILIFFLGLLAYVLWLYDLSFAPQRQCLLFVGNIVNIFTNYIKVNIDKIQKNSNRCHSRRDEMVNLIISECSNLALKRIQKRLERVTRVIQLTFYHECKRPDRMRRFIHWELCKPLGFDHVEKCYQHKLEIKMVKYFGISTPRQSITFKQEDCTW